jgi:predicted HAD superfamily phosphohydrolase
MEKKKEMIKILRGLWKTLKDMEVQFFHDAIDGIGGSYEFANENEAPTIVAYVGDSPMDVRLKSISKDGGHLEIVGVEVDSLCTVKVDLSDIMPGQVEFIISELPIK